MPDDANTVPHPARRSFGRAPLTLTALAVIALAALPGLGQDARNAETGEGNEPDVLLDWGDEQPRNNANPRRPSRIAPPPAEPTVAIPSLAEPMELTTLIDFVGATLNLNIVVKGTPTGQVVFNAPVEVPKSKLLDLLDAMLEQYSYTITLEGATGFYVVQPITDVRPSLGGERASVRIIPTPNIKPSQIASTLSAVLSAPSGASGGGNAVGAGSSSIQAVDELGVLIVNAPSRQIAEVEKMVAELMRIDSEQQFIRLELDHIAAPAALERAVGLVGAANAQSGGGGVAAQLALQNRREGGGNQLAGVGGAGTFSNLADRMTVDPQGNALIFRGTPDEIERVKRVLALIDVPNKLEPKSYFAGSAAAQIADIASRSGFGQVIQVENQLNNQTGNINQFLRQGQNQLGTNFGSDSSSTIGGPVMVVDTATGRIIYYGTPQQQKQLATLMDELRTEDERVVVRTYVLNHSDAVTVADLINAVITGEQQTGDSPLLPTQTGNRNTFGARNNQAGLLGFAGAGGGDDVSGAFDPDVVTVTAAEETNMIIINAPIRQQEELERLIAILDRRRAQVYIEAQIVSISDDEDFTLAFESQFLSGDFGISSNFGLGSLPNGFDAPRVVSAGLGGLTGAIIPSDFVPLIINATQSNTNARVLSSPQLLVNDNEESSIVSISEEPFTEITQTDGVEPLQGFGGFAEAGTQLTVTPSISDGGFLRLEYSIELSAFTEAVGVDGSPPPRDRNEINGAVTVPSDSTIVIGGITVNATTNTVAKIPLLGDVPLLGELFKRTDKIDTRSKLYVFLTPRIMTDANFNDLKLLTSGPQADMSIDGVAPPLEPVQIRTIAPDDAGFAESVDDLSLSPESIEPGA